MTDLPADLRRTSAPVLVAVPVSEEGGDTLGAAERDALLAVLEAQRWHVSRAAQQLGISRNTLYRKLNRHGLNRRTLS